MKLEDLRKIAEKRTKGEWYAGKNPDNNGSVVEIENRGRVCDCYQFLDAYSQDFLHDEHNAKFIAEISNHIDSLLDVVEAAKRLSICAEMTWHDECTSDQLRSADFSFKEALYKLESK